MIRRAFMALFGVGAPASAIPTPPPVPPAMPLPPVNPVLSIAPFQAVSPGVIIKYWASPDRVRGWCSIEPCKEATTAFLKGTGYQATPDYASWEMLRLVLREQGFWHYEVLTEEMMRLYDQGQASQDPVHTLVTVNRYGQENVCKARVYAWGRLSNGRSV